METELGRGRNLSGREKEIVLMIMHMTENGMTVSDMKKHTGVSDNVIAHARREMERKS